jgi:hypothetical protein
MYFKAQFCSSSFPQNNFNLICFSEINVWEITVYCKQTALFPRGKERRIEIRK